MLSFKKMGLMFYDLFNISNNTLIDRQDNLEDGIPELHFNESGEEFYLRYYDKLCVYLYKSMFKSLATHATSIAAKTIQNLSLLKWDCQIMYINI